MNSPNTLTKNNFIVCLIIGLCFLWTGAGYISWLYRLIDVSSLNNITANVDMLSEVYGYIFQVFGILAISLYIRKTGITFKKRTTLFIIIMVLETASIFPSVLASSFAAVLVSGYVMNFLIGCIGGLYLMLLFEFVPSGRRGIVFGLGYSIGSIGSWILSLAKDGSFLRSGNVLAVYLLIMAVTIGLSLIMDEDVDTSVSLANSMNGTGIILLTGIAVVLLCTTKGIGFYFPMADISNGTVSLELSRAFYAIGLIIAGLLNDYRRIWGAIFCVAALMFPFVLLAMTSNPEYSLYTWILSYIFIAFYNVFRVIIFADLADKTPNGLFLAPMGLMWGRLGDALGSAIGITLSEKPMAIILLGSVLFAVTLVLAFYLFQRIYSIVPVNVPGESIISAEEKLTGYSVYHDLSPREKEVLPLILEGHSNSEISGLIFVSENTVKFHVRNILKKTGCSNRQELAKDFQYFNKNSLI